MPTTLLLALMLATGADNRVTHGNFDQPGLQFGAGQTPGVWSAFTPAGAPSPFAIVAGEGRAGSAGARYYLAEDAPTGNYHLDQVIPVERDTVYEVTAWSRGDGRLKPLLTIATMGWRQLATALAPAEADWSQVRFLFHSEGNDQVRLEWFAGAEGRLYTGVAGTAWLDDVCVRPLHPVPPAVTRAFAVSRTHQNEEIDLATARSGRVGRPDRIQRITCRDGVLVYEDGSEVALWGVNLQTPLSWEYNGRLKPLGIPLEAAALQRITEENLDEIALMGAGVVRIHLLPADFTDAEGNLRDSVYLDVLDHLIARCRQKGLYVYLTLVNDMKSWHFPDSFLLTRARREWIFDPDFVARTERYVVALMRHQNRYTGRPYAQEEAIAVIELMNEPAYPDWLSLCTDPTLAACRTRFQRWLTEKGVADYPETCFSLWRYQTVLAYLQRMCNALRAAGARQPIIWNLNWPRMIDGHEDVFQAAADSPVDGVSFCLYPGQSDVPTPFWEHPTDLTGRNYLPYLRDTYTGYNRLRWLLGRRFARKAKMVYEFETFYSQSSYLYPAMARLMRSLGAQLAQMWQYTLTPAAEYLGGSHYLNLRCTPRKAASFAIAAEVFARTPRLAPYPVDAVEELSFDGVLLSFARDVS
ncbi:MAG: cellulase family glycosylhydrolase, partial [Armatimonadota bacterium]|nr:cellulase family glycosylhydrolase [Armatimonadota bacterium]